MNELWIDIETYSATPIDSGVYAYVEDPDFMILMAAWAIDDGPVQVAIGAEEIDAIPGLWDPRVIKRRVAHHAMFERVCFSRFAYLNDWSGEAEWPFFMPPELWRCTMAQASANGYPASLDRLGRAIGGELKDTAGSALVRWFCVPDRKAARIELPRCPTRRPRTRAWRTSRNGKRRLPEDHPEKWNQFVEYCRQDVVTMRDASNKMAPLSDAEQRVWEVDQHINDRGLPVDHKMAIQGVRASEANRMEGEIQVWAASGITNPSSIQQMMTWLHANGAPLPNLRKETVEKALERHAGTAVGDVLRLRQDLALVAAKKYSAALVGISEDNRLRGQLRFYGAHTGRWSGKGFQVHNMPQRGTIKMTEDEIDTQIAKLKTGVDMSETVLKSLVRSLFEGPFDVFDYASIEAIVVAWLAGEQWVLDAFRAHRDLYVETAERMGGLSRAEGKIAVLALGYSGGIGSLKALGGGSMGSDHKLHMLVNQWRKANPSICSLWGDLHDGFLAADRPIGSGRVQVEKDGKDRLLRLPSGRALVYRKAHHAIVAGPYGPRRVIRFIDPRTGAPSDTYGGRLAENITQAVARDVLADALVRLHDGGHRVVLHVHDEAVVESDGRFDEIAEVMGRSPSWAPDLPIRVEGFHTRRYRKE